MAGALAFSGYFCLRRPSFLQGALLFAMVYFFTARFWVKRFV